MYRGCIAAVSRLYRAVSRVSRRKIHMYRGCLTSIAAVSQESHVVSHCESVMYTRYAQSILGQVSLLVNVQVNFLGERLIAKL